MDDATTVTSPVLKTLGRIATSNITFDPENNRMIVETRLPEHEIDRLLADLSNYAVSFMKIETVNGREVDAACAGSGTLVRVGRLYGVLTAAHVLANLPKRRVGLAANRRQSVVQRLSLDMLVESRPASH